MGSAPSQDRFMPDKTTDPQAPIVAASRADTLDELGDALTRCIATDSINLIELTAEIRDPQYPEKILMTR